MIPRIHTLAYFLAIAMLAVAVAGNARAQEEKPAVELLPAKTVTINDATKTGEADLAEPTHPPLRVTPDKSALLRLETDVSSVVIGNPAHISILADSSRTLVVVPKLPGATSFTALDGLGNVIMQRHVIVAAPQEKYLRIRKSCAASKDKNCRSTQVYYCPDMCHEIAPNMETDPSAQSKIPASEPGPEAAISAAAAEAEPIP